MRASTTSLLPPLSLGRLATCALGVRHGCGSHCARLVRRAHLAAPLSSSLSSSCRGVCTLSSLVRVQTALQQQQQQQRSCTGGSSSKASKRSGGADDVKAAVAAEYAAFFHIPVAKGASVTQSMREHFARVQRQAARQLDSSLARLQQQQQPLLPLPPGAAGAATASMHGGGSSSSKDAACGVAAAVVAAQQQYGGGAALLLAGVDAQHGGMALYATSTDTVVTVPPALTSSTSTCADGSTVAAAAATTNNGAATMAAMTNGGSSSSIKLASRVADDDAAWQLASELMRCTAGATQLTVVAIVETAQERALVQPQLTALTHAMRATGLLLVAHVDTLELVASLTSNSSGGSGGDDKDDKGTSTNSSSSNSSAPPLLREVIASVAALRNRAPAPLSQRWFRAHWVYVRLLACRRADADPVRAVNELIVPSHDVFVVHLVQAGTRSLNVCAWDVVRQRRYAAKGMLSDVIACLLGTHAPRLILVPTNRTDRASLFRCRTALQKSGHPCVVVFASEVDARCRTAFPSEPHRYWFALRTLMGGGPDADVLVRVRVAAGNTLRAYHKKQMQNDGTWLLHYANTAEAAAKAKRAHAKTTTRAHGKGDTASNKDDNGNDDDDGDGTTQKTTMSAAGGDEEAVTHAEEALATSTEVEQWLRVFALPQRQRAEASELRHYTRYLVVAYAATEHTAYGQPANPVSSVNYVLCVCLRDHTGQQLEPVSKYTARGQFRLPSLDDYDVLIAHDAKRLLLLMCGDDELQRFLRRGGRVWCTMLAEYLLDAQRCRTGANSLRDVCLRHHVLLPACGVLGVACERLPLSFHATFLSQAAPALARVAATQQRRAVAQCQLLSLAHRMDALLAMAAMESAGIYVDAREAATQSRALRNAARALDDALYACIPPELPSDLRDSFDWASSQHLHAYFFGGLLTLGAVGEGDGSTHVPLHGGSLTTATMSRTATRSRDSATWTAHLIYLCYRYSGLFAQYANEVHLQRYATQCHISTTGGRLTQRVAQHIEQVQKKLAAAAAARGVGSNNNKASDEGNGIRFRVLTIDVETTGLNPVTDRMIELALYDPVEQSSFSTLINPQRRITPRTISIHHITDDDVRHAPTLETVMQRLVQYLRLDRASRDPREVLVIIGHGVFSLDEPMLRRAFEQYAPDVEYDGILFCDSLSLLRVLKSQLRSYAAQLKISGSNSSSSSGSDSDSDGGSGSEGGGCAPASSASRRSSGNNSNSNNNSKKGERGTLPPRRVHSIDHGLMDTLASSLRLSDLVAKLRVIAPGQMHRADADTKALWFVLVNVFGLVGLPAREQRDAVLSLAARSLLAFPAVGCFVPTQRRRCALHVRLAGVVHDAPLRDSSSSSSSSSSEDEKHKANTAATVATVSSGTTRTRKAAAAAATATSVSRRRLLRSLQAQPFSDRVLEALDRHFDLPVAKMLLQRRRLDAHTARFLHVSGSGGSSRPRHTTAAVADDNDVSVPGIISSGNDSDGGSDDKQLTTLHHSDQCVHQHIDMTATTTSRTTSAYPSCQNIPKDDKSTVRRLFASRFGPQGRCVEVDYAQLEIVVLANLCGDARLTRDLNAGVDFHIKRAAFFSGQTYAQIRDGYARGDAAATALRRTAKQFSFQRLYGAGVSLLHRTTGIAVADLVASIAREEAAYPAIGQFHRRVRGVALRPGNPGLPTHFLFELPTGLRMHFRTRDVLLNLPPLKNYPIQGYGAELAQMMVGRLYRHFLQRNSYDGRAFLVNFVHDSVWLDCHVDVLHECVRDTCAILSDVHTYVPRTFPGVQVTVPLCVTAACGPTMATLQRMHVATTGAATTTTTGAATPDTATSPTSAASTVRTSTSGAAAMGTLHSRNATKATARPPPLRTRRGRQQRSTVRGTTTAAATDATTTAQQAKNKGSSSSSSTITNKKKKSRSKRGRTRVRHSRDGAVAAAAKTATSAATTPATRTIAAAATARAAATTTRRQCGRSAATAAATTSPSHSAGDSGAAHNNADGCDDDDNDELPLRTTMTATRATIDDEDDASYNDGDDDA